MKRLIVFTLGLFLLTSCTAQNNTSLEEKPPIKEAPIDNIRAINGIITEVYEETVKIKTEDKILSLPREDITELDRGKNITLTYKNDALETYEISGEAYIALVKPMVEEMTIEEKVGQMFLVRVPTNNKAEAILDYNLGGYIFFARDFENTTPSEFKSLIYEFNSNSKIPMLMAVDEEGGSVVRISKYKEFRATPFKSPLSIYESDGLEGIISDTNEKCQFLKDLGINVNLAPVCDVAGSKSDYIYYRTIGKNAEETAIYTSTVVNEMKKNKIGSVLKHFPGYGSNVDTHTGIGVDERPYSEIMGKDMLPFISGIDADCDAILVSHNIVKSIDEARPSSLSIECHRILREDLGFNGVIMTDDIAMDAIARYTNINSAGVEAVLSGNDIIICTDYSREIESVINAVKEGYISEDLIDLSVTRILVWKMSLGLI